MLSNYLRQLESESIYIFREVVSSFENPVLLYSIGKDSSVLLHLAMKAFFPGKIPFPVLHIDTKWKFKEMIKFRDHVAEKLSLNLIVHTNTDAKTKRINPFDHSSLHTDVMKTEALKQALDQHGFDAAIGGARRDEEKSRAKERVFSFRNSAHLWDSKNQRAEFWNLFNGNINKGESVRVFPLSNWTEVDIWRYIRSENIPIVPLYFASRRPVVERDGNLIMVDDNRMRLRKNEKPKTKMIRFRTLGCYPLTAAIESEATDLDNVVSETLLAQTSERSGRIIDFEQNSSMEKKKVEGYF